jgi:hypothetical protein
MAIMVGRSQSPGDLDIQCKLNPPFAAFRRIPYEEWGLKSVPPLSRKREQEEVQKMEQVQVVYPKSIITREAAPRILETLATEREAFHRRKLIWCFVGMPFTAPIALIPV